MTEESNKQLLSKVVGTVRASASLAAQDVDFYRSLDKGVAKSLDKTSNELVGMINSTLLCIDQNSKLLEGGKEKLEDSRKDFSNLMDNLFEKSDRSLDTLKGRAPDRKTAALMYLDDAARGDMIPTKRIVKPQLRFKKPIDNTETHPFKPLLRSKPHALRPLSDSNKLIQADEDIPEHYPQPYEYEIENQEYNESILKIAEPIPSRPWDESEPVWVDNEESLKSMLHELKKCAEIAVDLEHHDYRSYYGIVCLMQISTREIDFLVDTLALRDDLMVLNEVFADPLIVKVFHGAFMDIIWLQRDLGLYVVGLFDTYHASRALGFPRHSLAYLLETFASFKTSKKYQLADWRVRPLSKAMSAYARSDTHFLLNIYDQLRNKLIVENKLAGVLAESRNVAKRSFQYSKYRPKIPDSSIYSPIDRADGWKVLMNQYNIPMGKEILVKNLYDWRDTIARRDDESSRYVMPNQLLAYLVDYTPLNPTGVISVSPTVTDHVRTNAKTLANLIVKSLQQIKDTGSDISAESTQHKDHHDLSQVLTVGQIESQVFQFHDLSKDLNDFVQGTKFSSPSSSIIFGNILHSPCGFVRYSCDSKTPVTDNQIKERKKELLEALDVVNENATTIQGENHSLGATNEFADGEKPPVENESNGEEDKEMEPEEDKNEIITLRKVKDRGKKSKRSNGLEQEEPIDYKKSKKLLETERKSKSTTKRSFDPYTASNDTENVPKPKKKRKMARGKSASFKR
ncbi:exosome nuclease subunit [Zygosaccharomyces mellis]|uniref:Exosome nuclease subunit n=1 Tax=Zygosaccharomyces mellis TaxID=42258 RepID=A0A4C2E5J6_9SACH|nr:exosome nuclease subunit [Zygosaccharomyces mellis]